MTTPDGAVVNLDGEPRGYAPLLIDNLSEGDHVLTISSTGYQEKTIKSKTVKGNKLIASVQLARDTSLPDDDDVVAEDENTESATPSASPKATPKTSPKTSPKASTDDEMARPYVQIIDDPGWVRVRTGPGTDNETVKDKDDDDLLLLSPNQFPLVNTDSGWYQIEYETGENGWISGKYAEKYE